MKTNYHTHTQYCDGREPIINFIKKAIELNFSQIGFSPHAPFKIPQDWSMNSEDDIVAFKNEIEAYKSQFPEIVILSALEMDYIPELTYNFTHIKNKYNLDYIIGSVHYVKVPNSNDLWFIDGKPEYYKQGIEKFFNFDIKKAVTCYFEQLAQMIENEDVDIIGHFDKIKMNNKKAYFTEDEEWYKANIIEILRLIKKKNIIMEINTRGFYLNKCSDFFPSNWVIKEAKTLEIPFVISSDAHHSNELDKGFDEVINLLKEIEYKNRVIYENNNWVEIGL